MTTYVFVEKQIKHIEQLAYRIMREEMQLKLRGSTLVWNNYLHKVRFLLFEDDTRWGFFDSEHFEIGIHKAAPDLENLLRHELAHMIAYLRFGDLSHGKIFRAICEEYGFNPDVKKASAPKTPTPNRMAEKIKKLLALGASNNANEAQSATLKAQKLLLTHSIDHLEEEMIMRRVFNFKRSSTKLHTIATILRTFGVQPVFNKSSLEIFGSRTHVEIAEYVAHFLFHELEQLYKSQPHLSGLAAKNSFFRGIADGYCKKIKKMQQSHERALVKIDFALQKAIPLAYPNLRSKSSRIIDHKAGRQAGEKKGHNLTIRKGVSSKGSIAHALPMKGAV